MDKTPKQYVEELVEMAREYQTAGNELVKIKVKKATEIIYIRAKADVKSDAQASRIWNATLDGIKELELTFKLKSLEKLMSAIKIKLRLMEYETRNQY